MQDDDLRDPMASSLGKHVDTVKDKAEAEERYRNLVDFAPDGIVIYDLDTGLFVDEANPQLEEIFGLSRDKLLGKLGPVDFSPEYQPDGRLSADAAKELTRAALAGEIQRFEWTHLNAQGEEIPCQITLVPFPDPSRRLVRGSIINISSQKKAEQTRLSLENQLAQSQRLELIGQMTGGVAHDFNNVLSALLGHLELLLERVNDAETKEIIQSAINATEQGAGLTRAMLNYARQAPLKPKTFKLSEVVQKMEELISRTIPARIALKTDLTDEHWMIRADPSTTESAILNLVLNAVDAMTNDGYIRIELSSVSIEDVANTDELMLGSYVVLSIEDTGEGIPDDVIDKIDDPFFTTKGLGQHSGLGLSMVQGFMSQSGGYLRVQSKIGVGTTIKLYFPAIDHPQHRSESASVPVPTSSGVRSGRILLVEDNRSVRELLALTLRREGYEVLTAHSTESAIQVFNEAKSLDLLITDIAIPGKMQGPQLAKLFKESRQDLKLIYISGYSFGLETQKVGLVESDVLITKPFRQALLLNAVEEAMLSVPL